MADRLNQLHRERGVLKLQGRVRDMIPVQIAIIAEAEKTGRVRDLANAWNYLSALHHQAREYDEAERAARKALEVYAAEPKPNAEVLGCHHFGWLRFSPHSGGSRKPHASPRRAFEATLCSTIGLTSS